MRIPNNNINSEEVEEIHDVQRYVSEFFTYLQNATGLTRESFTTRGLQNHVKSIARRCFQLQICGEILQSVFRIASLLSRFFSGNLEEDFNVIESAIEEFVEILYRITNYLVEYFLGQGLLMITSTMSDGMVAFVIFLFHAVMYVYQTFSLPYFSRFKDWILTLCNSDEVKCFFERVFANYGRALTMA